MSSGDARRLARRLDSEVMAREILIDALPPGSRVTFVVQLDAAGAIKHVRMSTDSDLPHGGPSHPGGNRRSEGMNGRN